MDKILEDVKKAVRRKLNRKPLFEGTFLKLNDKAKIYIKKSAFQKYYVKIGKIIPYYIGLNRKYENNPRFVFTEDCTVIDDELTVFSGVQSHAMCSRLANGSLFSKPAHRLEPDTFEHEQYLILSDDSGRTLVTGCSHKGIINILDFYSQKFGYSDRVLTNVIGVFICSILPETKQRTKHL